MTREEFIAKTEKENWPKSYVEGMLKVVDESEAEGIKFPYSIILSPGAIPVA